VPIYEYECKSCGDRFEILLLQGDPEPTCSSCGADEVRKLMSPTNFQLKGSGWYATDYGPAKKAATSKSNGKPRTEQNTSESSTTSESTTEKTSGEKQASTGAAS